MTCGLLLATCGPDAEAPGQFRLEPLHINALLLCNRIPFSLTHPFPGNMLLYYCGYPDDATASGLIIWPTTLHNIL